MKKSYIAWIMFGMTMLGMSGAADASPVQWSSSAGGNDHWYEAVSYHSIWDMANANAQTRVYNGMQGYLATLTSAAENRFVWGQFGTNGYWLGGYQINKNAEPAGAWAWVTGEPWSYTNWSGGEPNNAGGDEDHMQFWANNGTWNDMHNNSAYGGYIVEYEKTSVPEPASLLLLGTGLLGVAALRRRKA